MSSPDQIEAAAQAVADVCASVWDQYSEESKIGSRSKSWWNQACADSLAAYRESRTHYRKLEFKREVREAKCKFFEGRINEIASSNKRPWDLMDWVKQRELPPSESLEYQGHACNSLPQLWEALHGTYNSASGRVPTIDVLDPLPDAPVREWIEFSTKEMEEALRACSSRSAPGPDHVGWGHLKGVVFGSDKARDHLLALANACLRVGYWPEYFKASNLVIIPKPGKPSYSTPKSFFFFFFLKKSTIYIPVYDGSPVACKSIQTFRKGAPRPC